jgi:hypothetical protein
MSNPTALVTGASSGIGLELSKQFADHGYDVVLVARREERLRDLASAVESEYGVTATVLPTDLADPDGPQELFDDLADRGIDVHTLVNNAGVSSFGHFDETDVERDELMIDVNVAGLTRLTKLFVRPMVERGRGEILNTASMVGLAPTPHQAVYSGTKHYVRSLSEAIAHELEPKGITVTALCPGPVDTDMIDEGGLEKTSLGDGNLSSPADVARAGFEGLREGKRLVVPSTKMKVLSQLTRALPRKQIVSLAASTYE